MATTRAPRAREPGREVRGSATKLHDIEPADIPEDAQVALGDLEQTPGDLGCRPRARRAPSVNSALTSVHSARLTARSSARSLTSCARAQPARIFAFCASNSASVRMPCVLEVAQLLELTELVVHPAGLRLGRGVRLLRRRLLGVLLLFLLTPSIRLSARHAVGHGGRGPGNDCYPCNSPKKTRHGCSSRSWWAGRLRTRPRRARR